MVHIKKRLSVLMALIVTLAILLSAMPQRAEAKVIIPEIKFISAPVTEYSVGDRVRFDISTPNYGGRVEYRVVLWNNTTKTYSDLWNSSNGYPNRYYTKWQPYGNNVFTLGWPISEPGSYRITVYAKRVGIPNSQAALKGKNCDSFKESVAFKVNAKSAVFDKEGQKYGSSDANKLEKYNTSLKLTANNITFSNASVNGDVYITGNNASLNNITVTGKVVIDPGKDGDATLEKVTAKKIEVLSGGTNSIHIKNVKADEMNVSSQNTVRIETDGDTEIVAVTADGYVIFDKKSGTFGTIKVTKNEVGETVVEFRGDIKDTVVVEGSAKISTATGSSISNLVVAPKDPASKITLQGTFTNVGINTQTNLEVATGAKINSLEVKAKATVNVLSGASIQTLDTNNNVVVVNNQGTIVKQESSVDGSTSGGGIPGGYIPPESTFKLDIISAVLKTGGTLKLTAISNMDNSITWSSNNPSVAKIDATGLVTGVGEGTVVITVKSVNGVYTATATIKVVNYNLNSKVEVSGSSIKLTLTSSIEKDEVTIKIIDSKGNIQFIGQDTILSGSKTLIIPLEAGSYTCFIKGLGTDSPIEFNFTK